MTALTMGGPDKPRIMPTMANQPSLNPRQLDVLQWIADGCPASAMNDTSYKTVAVALQSRRLVTISKRHGIWTATVTEVGTHYLHHGEYPESHPLRHQTPASESTLSTATPMCLNIHVG